jgi:hypothetical protein
VGVVDVVVDAEVSEEGPGEVLRRRSDLIDRRSVYVEDSAK